MSALNKELVYLILQFLNEENLNESLHKFEKETGVFFNMSYFEGAIQNGEWDEVENYLSGFTKIYDNKYSMKIFFEIRRQRYLEALDNRDHPKAVKILTKELKFVSTFAKNIYKEFTMLLTLQNFRENERFRRHGDIRSTRVSLAVKLKKWIESNPIFHGKLHFPILKNSGLRTLVNQRQQSYGDLIIPSITNPSISSGTRVDRLLPIGFPSPLSGSPGPSTTPYARWQKRPISAWNISTTISNNADPTIHEWKTPRIDRLLGSNNNIDPYNGSSNALSDYSIDDVSKIVIESFNQGQTVMSMDFHPMEQTQLLVSAGDLPHNHGTNAPNNRRAIIWVERPLMRRFGPTGITSDIMDEVMRHLPSCAPTWKTYPRDMKEALYANFKAKYRFASTEDEALSRVVWDRTCQDRYRDNMRKIRIEGLKKNNTNDIEQIRGNPPREIRVDIWNELVDHWLSEEFQRRSESGRANRSALPNVALSDSASSTE